MMLHPKLLFDARVRMLQGNEELLFYRALMLASLIGQTNPPYIDMVQVEAIMFDLWEPDDYGHLDRATHADLERYCKAIQENDLWVSHSYEGYRAFLFAEDLAALCFPGQANPQQVAQLEPSKTAKQIDPELSKKRSEAGRKGAASKKQKTASSHVQPFTLKASDDEDAA